MDRSPRKLLFILLVVEVIVVVWTFTAFNSNKLGMEQVLLILFATALVCAGVCANTYRRAIRRIIDKDQSGWRRR